MDAAEGGREEGRFEGGDGGGGAGGEGGGGGVGGVCGVRGGVMRRDEKRVLD